jgi:RNA recognition motif-containing protein
MNLYVGNLPYDISEEELKQAFEVFGQVETATIVKDKFTGTPRGFGFVEMPEKESGQAAITGMDGKEFKGRVIRVNEAKPRSEGGGHRGGGGGYRGGGGGGGRRSGGGGGGGGYRGGGGGGGGFRKF